MRSSERAIHWLFIVCVLALLSLRSRKPGIPPPSFALLQVRDGSGPIISRGGPVIPKLKPAGGPSAATLVSAEQASARSISCHRTLALPTTYSTRVAGSVLRSRNAQQSLRMFRGGKTVPRKQRARQELPSRPGDRFRIGHASETRTQSALTHVPHRAR